MAAGLDAWIDEGVRDDHRIRNPSDGTHRIPHPNEVQLDLSGIGQLKAMSRFEPLGHTLGLLRLGGELLGYVWDETFVARSQQAVHKQKPSQCPGCVRASREPEE